MVVILLLFCFIMLQQSESPWVISGDMANFLAKLGVS